jgi:hypothetical protein
VSRSADLLAELRRHEVGDVVTLEVEGPNGTGGWQIRQVQVPLMRFPLQDLITHFLTAYVVGLIYLALGIWVFVVKGHRPSGRAFAFFCAILGLFAASYFDLISTHWLVRLWTAAVPLAAASIIHLGLVFPQERIFIGKWRVLHYLPYAVAGMVAAWGEVYPPKRGAAWLAMRTGSPLIPVAIQGTQGTLSVDVPGLRRVAIRAWVEPPLLPDDYLDRVDPIGAMMDDWHRAMDRRLGPWQR